MTSGHFFFFLNPPFFLFLPYPAAENYVSKLLARRKKSSFFLFPLSGEKAGKLVRRQLTRISAWPPLSLRNQNRNRSPPPTLCALARPTRVCSAWLDDSTFSFKLDKEERRRNSSFLTALDPEEVEDHRGETRPSFLPFAARRDTTIHELQAFAVALPFLLPLSAGLTFLRRPTRAPPWRARGGCCPSPRVGIANEEKVLGPGRREGRRGEEKIIGEKKENRQRNRNKERERKNKAQRNGYSGSISQIFYKSGNAPLFVVER